MGVKVNMNNIKLLSSVVAIAIGLGACQKQNMIELEPNIAYKSEKVETQVEMIPDWYMNLPSDDKIIYSSGTANAPDMQLAVDVAILNAKTVLADRINGKLDSMTKSFMAKIGSDDLDTSVLTEIEKVTKNVIASVDVSGYKVDESKIVKDGTQYRAYVLLAYDNEEATKIMLNRMKKDRMVYSRLRSTKAWKELENQVNKSKDEDEAKSMENVERLIDENDTSI
tara:strand:- start:269 stop:943 length:675 start_codon:yes stop_codon:yes gene_type:complete